LSPIDRTKYPSLQNSPPQRFFLHLWKLLEHHLSRDTLYDLHNLCRRIPRRGRQKQMDMIILQLHRIYLKLIPLGYLRKYFSHSFGQIPFQNHLTVFGNPYHMIFQIVDRMACSFYRAHAVLIPCFIASRTCFHPPSRAGRYSTGIFINFITNEDVTPKASSRPTCSSSPSSPFSSL